VSIPIGAGVYTCFESVTCAAIAFTCGILIDLDHIFDFLVNHSIKNYRSFFEIMYACRLDKVYLFLHSYELIAALWVAVIGFEAGPLWSAAAIGFTQHLLFDQFTNPVKPWTYFLIVRIFHGFRKNELIV